MSEEKEIRYSFDWLNLKWKRTMNGETVYGRDDIKEPADPHERMVALIAEYKKITRKKNKTGKEYSKSALVKRLPWLSQENPKATKNKVDGMLRSLFIKIKKVNEKTPGSITEPPKLSWYVPPEKNKKVKIDPVATALKHHFGS